MGNAVYPELPGRDVRVARTVIPPKVNINTTPSEREYRSRNATVVRYGWSLQYNVLDMSAGELQALVGFYALRGGPFDSFLFRDPDEYIATDEAFGLGNGSATQFQLLRTVGGYAEPIYDPVASPAPVISVGGVVQASGYTIAAGLVTFSAAPGSGQALTWSGRFRRRVRFDGERLDTSRFAANLYEAGQVRLISSKD